jgi:hypothetical protein
MDLSEDGTTWPEQLFDRDQQGYVSAEGVCLVPIFAGSARFVRLNFFIFGGPDSGAVTVRDLRVHPRSATETNNDLTRLLASLLPKGRLPQPFLDRQTNWTVFGAPSAAPQGLVSEHGSVETMARGPSLEPFVRIGGKLLTWADASHRTELAGGFLPIPSVVRSMPDWELRITPINASSASLHRFVVRYGLKNTSRQDVAGSLFVALRPFQVNPPWQFLNGHGGYASVGTRSTEVAGPLIVCREGPTVRFTPEPLHVAGSNEALVQDDLIALQSQCALHINGSYAYRSRGYRRCDQLRRAHGHGGHSEHWDRSPDFR